MVIKEDLTNIFDEQSYLDKNPDVAKAVAEKRQASGWNHFIKTGRFEGRMVGGFDREFYLQTYPAVAREIADGLAVNAIDHYIRFGRGRGYLPRAGSERPLDSAGIDNQFGGLWTDQRNARDLVEGKLEVGHISADEAEALRFWIDNGYIIIPDAIPEQVLDAALVDFEKAYSGKLHNLRFECEAVVKSRLASPWQKEMNEFPAKALDVHFHSSAIRDLIFSKRISRFLSLLFNAPAFATQSLGFFLGSAQEGHQDSAYVAYTNPLQFCASWIALEDVTIGAGELFYYPGSHRFPNFLYGGEYKSLDEAKRMNENTPRGQVAKHVQKLAMLASEYGLQKKLLDAKKGDALIWHADLVHGGNPVSKEVTRKSVVTHYCPKFVSPLYAENRKTQRHQHDGHYFSTSYYMHSQPG